MTASKCCCSDVPCDGDCTAVRADCCSTGLRPFTVEFDLKMRQSTCSGKDVGIYSCSHDDCTSWGTVDCGGCLACDPNGTAPGANGRTCPCRESECSLPPGRQFPLMPCKPKSPYLSDGCYYGYPDFYYMTFTPTGGEGPCDLPTEPPCDWLGSVSCQYELRYVTAGFSYKQCTERRFTHSWLVDQIESCIPGPDGFPIQIPLPEPNCTNSQFLDTFYGQQLCPPGDLPPYTCTACIEGRFPQEVVVAPTQEQLDECNFDSVTARVHFVMPCATGVGQPLSCQHGCDCYPSSYIALEITAAWADGYTNDFGYPLGWTDFDPNDPDDADYVDGWCESMIGPPPSEPGPCGPVLPLVDFAACGDKCCICGNALLAVFRRKRTPADGDLCTMAYGDYELVAVGGGCGPLGADYYCGDPEQGTCKDAVDQCMPEGILRKRLEQNGIWNATIRILPP